MPRKRKTDQTGATLTPKFHVVDMTGKLLAPFERENGAKVWAEKLVFSYRIREVDSTGTFRTIWGEDKDGTN